MDIYQSSPKYEDELYEKSNAFYDRGCKHILYQFHQHILEKALMCRMYEGSYIDFEFKGSCDFVPFTESELVKIATTDLKEGRYWSLPALVSSILSELCARFRGTVVVAEPS